MQCQNTPYMFLKVPPVMYEQALDFVTRKYVGHVFAQTRERINELNIEQNKDNEWVKEQTKKLREITDFCKDMGVRCRKYKTQSYTQIKVNLEGWEYADQLCVKSAKRWFYHDSIKVIIDFRGHKTRTGVWKEYKGELQVDAPYADWGRGPSGLDRLKDDLFFLTQRVRHEMAHVAQSFITKGSESQEYCGIPSRHLRPDHTCPKGYQFDPKKLRFKRKRLAHPLRDIEFFPRLDDEIQQFMWELRDIEDDPELRRRAVKLILLGHDGVDGAVPSNLLYGLYGDLEDAKHRHQRFCQYQPRTFKYLQRNQPQKHREACRKFVKALSEIGFLQ